MFMNLSMPVKGASMMISRAVANGLKGTIFLVIAGCAGNGEGLDANGRPIADGTVSIALSADFQSIQDNVFTPICSVCHVGGGAPMGLRLDAADAYNLLVGVPSTEVPSILRVKPGDPDNSYIIQKLEGHASVGARMPFGGPYLTADTISFIRQWISNGAPPAATAAAQTVEKFAVVGVVPDDTEPVSQSPPQITVAFNQDLDLSQIDPQSARIERLDPQNGAVLEMLPAHAAVPDANHRALMIWPARALGVGHYQALMRTAQPAGFANLSGQTAALGTANANGEFVLSTFDVEVLP
jgi:mono/diheme cytochrome c family protein